MRVRQLLSPANIPEVKDGPELSKGERLYERLVRFVRLRRSFAGYCVVCGDMLELLDEGLYRKALGLLRKLKCQVIIELKRDYPYGGARHFVCYSDSATKSSRVEIFDR